MKIKFAPYKKRDGNFMLYVNSSNKVSVGISEEGYSPYGKGMTEGKRNAMNAAKEAFYANAIEFTGKLEDHKEGVFECGPYVLAITDVASVGGMPVGSDGAYVIRDGKILPCGQWV